MSYFYLDGVKNIFKYFNSSHRKEKLDYVLEPLQAMIQLCLLSFCPVGTKLTIYDNLLYIQQTGIGQGIIRYLNDDTKDDLYFLMNVFRRFIIYYDFLKTDYPEFYQLLIHYSQQGLDKLIQTYSDATKVSLLHSLKMYKLILKNSNFFESVNGEYYENAKVETTETKDKHMFINWFLQIDNEAATNLDTEYKTNFDNVFKEIRNIYKADYLKLYENILKTLILNKDNIENTIEGTNLIFKPINEQIKKWINQHIAL
jgi:hypothetical protein